MPEAAASSGRVHLTVADAGAWRAWLDEHEDGSDGVWLTLAKKGAHAPTSLTYREALDEALCSGWIDGRKNSIDDATFRQHFTPRRRRSLWSARNVELVAALTAAGRMRDRGRAEVDRARADGRWDRAYAGAATIEVPTDLLEALQASPVADASFRAVSRSTRYPIVLDVTSARTATTRATRISRHVAKLATDHSS